MSADNLEWKANCRLKKHEFENWVARAKLLGVKRSRILCKLVREFLTGDPYLIGSEVQAFKEAVWQVGAVGRNLNQMVHWMNKGGQVPGINGPEVVEELLLKYTTLEQRLIAIQERSRKRLL